MLQFFTENKLISHSQSGDTCTNQLLCITRNIYQSFDDRLEKAKSHILDLDGLNRLSKEHQNNPIIGYLNINSLRNKINDLRKIYKATQIHVYTLTKERFAEQHKCTTKPSLMNFALRATSIPLSEKIAIKMVVEKLCM